MTPRESYLAVKAHKARQDAHYGQMAAFVATLYNAHGHKKKLKPKDLYEPNLVRPRQGRQDRPGEPDEAELRRRRRERKSRIERLEREHPVGGGPARKKR